MNRELAREVRSALTDARAVCEKLGLLGGKGTFARQAGGLLIKCPAHADNTPSCSVRRGPDGTIALRCHGCGFTGDVLTLVAQVHGLSLRTDFKRVLVTAAELAGLWQVVEELEHGTPRPPVAAPAPRPPALEIVRDYPALDEVLALWGAGAQVATDAEARAWFDSRGLDAEAVGEDVARVVAPDTQLPRWASYRGSSWCETGHRVLVPMRDAFGEIRTLRAVRIVDGDSPKRLPPAGHKAAGVVMACPLATAMLEGRLDAHDVLIVEGEPDFFVAATAWRLDRATAKIGIVSGAWSPAFAMRVPIGATVYIWTHLDEAGDRYAEEIRRTVQRSRGCRVLRWDPTVAA